MTDLKDIELKTEDTAKVVGSAIGSDVSNAVLHQQVSKRLMVIVALVLALLVGLYIHGAIKDGAAQARIEAMVKTNADQQKATVEELKESFAKQVELAKQQKTIETHIIERDKSADKAKGDVLAPDRSVDQTTKDVKDYLGMLPQVTPDKLFSFTQPDTQKLVGFKIDLDRYKQDYTDSQKDLGIAKERVTDLDNDKTVMQQTIDGDKKTIGALDKQKNPSSFKQYIKLGGVFVLGIVLDHELHK